MNDLVEGIGIIVVTVMAAFLISVVGGTLFYFIYEDSIQAMFPKAVETGVLAATLTWWQSVKIVWIFTILIKSGQTTDNKSSSKNPSK